jgi:hypothetical protein
MRSVVSGRVVNVFSTQDYILGFLYRTSSVQLGIAGLQPVVGVRGIQNVDVTELVDGHLQYRFITGSILRKIGFEDVDIAEVEKAEHEMAKQKQKEEAERKKNEGEATGDEEKDGEREKQKMEGEVQKKSEQSMWQVMQDKTKSLDIGGFFGTKDDTGEAPPTAGQRQELKKA